MPVPTETTPGNIPEVRAEIARIARRLDAESRYVRELLAIVDGAGDVEELRVRLIGSRGERHAGADVFARMSLGEKILANLITPETTLFRFSEGELEALDREILPGLRGRTAEILIVPCSHGEEAFTTAAYLLKVGVDFRIRAYDVQPALIDEAKTGRLTFGFPVEHLASPGFVSKTVLDRIHFQVGDAFALPQTNEEFDVVMCRNFVGYFRAEEAEALVRALHTRVRASGALFLDSFCLHKFGSLQPMLEGLGAKQLRGRPVFRT